MVMIIAVADVKNKSLVVSFTNRLPLLWENISRIKINITQCSPYNFPDPGKRSPNLSVRSHLPFAS
jgi:hypothetical protein